jgi:hypothetical protein
MESLVERIAALESAIDKLHGQRQAVEQKTRRWRGASLSVGALVLRNRSGGQESPRPSVNPGV